MTRKKVIPVGDTADDGKQYVHEPGTTHLNAFETAVQEAEAKVREAESELDGAKHALEVKKQESRFE